MGENKGGTSRPGPQKAAAVLGALLLLPGFVSSPGAADRGQGAALSEVARVRAGLALDAQVFEDDLRDRSSHGRPAVEVEGWRRSADGGRWPADQATYDVWSGLLSKYVNFDNSSRRRQGEAILPMGSISPKADAYLGLFYPRHGLSLQGIERYRVRGKESVYYEVRYSTEPREVLLFHPVVRMLIDASTGNLYRFELAADYLDLPPVPKAIIGGEASARIAAVVLGTKEARRDLDGALVEGEIFPTDLYYVRPNDWLGAAVPGGGKARIAWVIPFRTARNREGTPHLVFIDALTGRGLGGVEGR